MNVLNAWRCIMLDPKTVAEMDWYREFALAALLALQGYDLTVELPESDPPNFEWWEPRYDTPGRREQTRAREMGVA